MEKLVHGREKSNKKWWALWVVLVICVLVIGATGAVFCYFYYAEARDDSDIPSALVYVPKETCLTRDCLEATTKILSSLDGAANPCEDFYQFTCGNFIEEGHAESDVSQFVAKLRVDKNRFISSPIRGDEPNYLLSQKTFFQSCINLTAIDLDEGETLQELLEGIGGWPIVKGQYWAEWDITLENFLVQCKNLGLPFQWLFEIKYSGSWNALLIYPPKIQYNEQFFDNTYKKLIVEIATELGASKYLTEREVIKMAKFARELQNIILRNNQSDFVIMESSEIDYTFPMDNSWTDFLNNITVGANYTITENDTVMVVETYLRELHYLLGNTPKSVQFNYLIWNIILYFKQYLPKRWREKFENRPTSPALSIEPTTRFQFCIEDAKNKFPPIVEHEFIKWYIDEEKTESIMNMTTNIKNQFILRLELEDWIDDETKDAAKADLDDIVEILGKRRLQLDEKNRERFLNMSDLRFTSDNVIAMITEKNIYDFDRHIVLTDVEEDLQVDISKVIDLVMAATPDILYSVKRPNYLNYGTLGSKIGRKITEQLFRKALYQNLNEQENYFLWSKGPEEIRNETSSNDTKTWSIDSISALLKRTQCLVDSDDSNSEISDDETSVSLTISVDFVGVNTAYDAYINWVEEHEAELKLVSLPFSPEQLFWIQYGNTNCFRNTDNEDWANTEDRHADVRYRLHSLLRNSVNFAKDFGCPLDTPMNPVSKCHIF